MVAQKAVRQSLAAQDGSKDYIRSQSRQIDIWGGVTIFWQVAG